MYPARLLALVSVQFAVAVAAEGNQLSTYVQKSVAQETDGTRNLSSGIEISDPLDVLTDWPNAIRSIKDEIQVECDLPERNGCYPDSKFVLLLDDDPIETKDCVSHADLKAHASFSPRVNDSRIMNKLRCEYRKMGDTYKTKESPVFPFLHCPTQSPECANKDCPVAGNNKETYCLWTLDGGPEPCRVNFDAAWCEAKTLNERFMKKVRYCPVDKLGFCAAMAEDPTAVWYSRAALNDCLPKTTNSPVSYKGKPLKIGQFIVMDSGDMNDLRFECPLGSSFYESNISIWVDLQPKEFWCTGHAMIPYKDPRRLHVRTGVWHFYTWLHGNHSGAADFSYRVIHFGAVSLTVDNSPDTNPLRCRMDNGPEHVDQNFRIDQWWTRKLTEGSKIPSTSHIYEDDLPSGKKMWLLNIAENDDYQCHVIISFESCSPRFTAPHPISSKIIRTDVPHNLLKRNQRGNGCNMDIPGLTTRVIVASVSIQFIVSN